MKLSAVPVGLNMPIKGIKKNQILVRLTPANLHLNLNLTGLDPGGRGGGGGVVDNAGFRRFFFRIFNLSFDSYFVLSHQQEDKIRNPRHSA